MDDGSEVPPEIKELGKYFYLIFFILFFIRFLEKKGTEIINLYKSIGEEKEAEELNQKLLLAM